MAAEKPSSLPSAGGESFKVQLHDDSFSGHLIDELPDLEVETSKDQLVELYRQMTTMRRMEQAADQLYKAKLIRGFCHLAIGQVRNIFFYYFAKHINYRKPLQSEWKLL